ncbi:type II secretion system protein GspM [Glaciimonas sp. PAMC28666]|uniref:type II secretion system protein GspM n=1 Tax=Glaciimonas sp. PAMC28666 TaxID=2807626 RepID=UPI0019644548|nr:type II secretion system protein M [Glaciimonas sp. PAMC28666]QRX81647.1 type II secretion system protein M [Glaciimonas sp. PAMC28666]
MNSAFSPLRQPAGKIRVSALAYWSQRDQRERRLLASAGAFTLLVLVYLSLIQPALDGRARLQKDLPALRQQAADMQSLVERAALVAAQPAERVLAPLDKEAVQSALKNKGLTAQSVVMSGDTARVQMDAVDFAGLLDWLTNVQLTAHWQVVDASVNALNEATQVRKSVQPGNVNATVLLSQPRHQ